MIYIQILLATLAAGLASGPAWCLWATVRRGRADRREARRDPAVRFDPYGLRRRWPDSAG